MKKIKIGSVILFKANDFFRIAQITHKDPMFGWLIRVSATKLSSNDAEIKESFFEKLSLTVFFPAQTAVNQNLAEIIGQLPLLPPNAIFPIFKTRNVGREGEAGPWWFYDGVKEWMVDRELSKDEILYPRRVAVNFAGLIEMLNA